MLALYEYDERDRCVGSSGHAPHPSRVSLEAGQIDGMQLGTLNGLAGVVVSITDGAKAQTYGSAGLKLRAA